MRPKISPVVIHVIKHIIECIDNGQIPVRAHLSPIKQFASQLDVSKNTVSKAYRLLQHNGIISTAQGRKTTLVSTDTSGIKQVLEQNTLHRMPQPFTELAWQKLYRVLLEKIHQGVYAPGTPLPSLKELETQYHTTYRTLARALHELEQNNLLVRHKKTFSVKHIQVARPQAKIVFLTIGNPKGGLRLYGPSEEIHRHLELICSQRNLTLISLTHDYYQSEFFYWGPSEGKHFSLFQDDSVIGYFFLASTFRQDAHRPVLQDLCNQQKPVAILDLVGNWRYEPAENKPNVHLFSAMITTQPGRHVGRHLLSLGHSNLAYISPFHQSAWSRRRLDGLAAIYKEAGIDHALHPCTLDRPPVIYRYYEDHAERQCPIDDLVDFYESWRKQRPQDFVALIDPLFDYQLPHIIIPRAEFYRALRKLFDQALACRHVSAWVCANDDVAVAAASYLRTKRIAVPDRIALIGFDDTLDAVRNKIASYNFNLSRVVNLLVQTLISNPISAGYAKSNALDIEGIIINRMTLATRR
ncbi:MAG: GntR family transcriptional regulator [Chitinivibrionales bacterium]|nr:GntR family transcriptional regulator [Chitinivibrionales bacterium]